jgi:hypothetical protein
MAKDVAAVARFVVGDAEREVADLLPIEADLGLARATVAAVPFWFHTFALNVEAGIYTPGAARDHRYRLPFLPSDLTGERVLDVGMFDGFYAFLCASTAAPGGWWRSITSSTGRGSRPGGGSSLKAAPGFARSAVFWIRGSSIGGWTRSRSRICTSGLTCVVLRDPAPGREPARAAAHAASGDGQWRHGAGRGLRPRACGAQRVGDPGLRAGRGLRA